MLTIYGVSIILCSSVHLVELSWLYRGDRFEYVHRFTVNMTNLKTAHKRSWLYHIVQDDFGNSI